MAALELPADQEALKAKLHENVSVMVATNKSEFLICTLNCKSLNQQVLDLNFNEGEDVTFFTTGSGTVHLTGYTMEYESGMEIDEEDSEEEELSDEVPELVPAQGTKRKKSLENGKSDKKTKWFTPGGGEFIDDSDVSDDDEDDADDDFANASGFIDMKAEEDEEDEDYSDESEDEAEDTKSPQKTPKLKSGQSTPKAKKDKTATPKPKIPNAGDSETKSSQKKKQEETPASSVGVNGDTSSKKKKKKKKNKSMTEENQQQSQAAQNSKSSQQAKTPQPTKNAQVVKTPQQNTKETISKQTPQQNKTPQQSKTPKKMVLQGGVLAEEIHIGDGPVAKAGKMMHVYYVGKLQRDGKQFDSCTKGKPFNFKLGLGEVIKGWDAGIEGMKVGGKRRLTIPPNQGYAQQRSGPIPPNSTLVFEVELKNIT